MIFNCLRHGILVASADNVTAVYYVTRTVNGMQSVHRIVEEHDEDTNLAVKQIALRATEDSSEGVKI